jgi:hypothetical protein
MTDLPFALPRFIRRVGHVAGIVVHEAEVINGKTQLFGPGCWFHWSEMMETEPEKWEHSDNPAGPWWKIVPLDTEG